jgi:RNA polymerase sigma factor (sigma-70 family)
MRGVTASFLAPPLASVNSMSKYVGYAEHPLGEAVSHPERMSVSVQNAVPPVLARLLAADNDASEDAWTRFVDDYSRLLLFVARRTTPDYDSAMDAYTFVLEKLREHELHRLRGYAADGRGKFTTWLVVVTRRLCLDHHRHRYGRLPDAETTSETASARVARRQLVDLAFSTSENLASHANEDDPEGDIRRAELDHALDIAMRELAPPDRLLIALRFHDGLSGAEIASLLHLPSPFHVYRRLNHVLRALRERLSRLGVWSSSP